MKLPVCLGHRDYDGDYDCHYPNAPCCEECLVTYHKLGGTINPKTGKRLPLFILWLLYGKRNKDNKLKAQEEACGK